MYPTRQYPPRRGVRREPMPLPAARGRGFLAERLLSINSLVSLLLLGWSAAVLRRPELAWGAVRWLRRHFPWLVGEKNPRYPATAATDRSLQIAQMTKW